MIKKDPQASLWYHVRWANWLAGDTISSIVWTVPDGLTKVAQQETSTTAFVKLSGGVAGNTYKVICHIVTALAVEDDRTLVIYVEDR